MTTIIAHNPLGDARCARGIEYIKRVGGVDRNAIGRGRRFGGLQPVDIAALDHFSYGLRALIDNGVGWFVRGKIDGPVEQWFYTQ